MEADAEAKDGSEDADTDLGEEALQRAARIEYAIKALKKASRQWFQVSFLHFQELISQNSVPRRKFISQAPKRILLYT